jgi:hypothetical protein
MSRPLESCTRALGQGDFSSHPERSHCFSTSADLSQSTYLCSLSVHFQARPLRENKYGELSDNSFRVH